MSVRTQLGLLILLLVSAAICAAQSAARVMNADLAVPFGQAQGFLVVTGEDLIFVNRENPASSISIPRSQISDTNVSDRLLTVQTRESYHNQNKFTFRIPEGDLSAITSWTQAASAAASQPAGTAQASTAPAGTALSMSFQVQHKHFPRGSCDGRLLITDDRISFESVSKIEHSRQWDMKDIKEFKRDSPYDVTIDPFIGGGYDFRMVGTGMSSRDYQMIVDRIATMRAPR